MKILVMDIVGNLVPDVGYHNDFFDSLVYHNLSNLMHKNEETPQLWLINFQLSNYVVLEQLVALEVWLGLRDDFFCRPVLVMALCFDIFDLKVYLLNMKNVPNLFCDVERLPMSPCLEMAQGSVDQFGVNCHHHLEV